MAWRHTSVIYVHGVGSPQRHVSLSNFLDFFDLYGQTQSKVDVGKPRKFTTNAEFLGDEIIHYVEFKKVNIIDEKPVTTRTVRVYEAYWVPEALTKFGPIHLLFWLITRIRTPILVLFSRWRSYSALKLASLHRLSLKYPHPGRIEKLERFYRDFENWEGRSRYKSGTFKQYLTYVASTAHERDKKGLGEAAYRWRREFWKELLASFAMIGTLLGTLIWVAALALYSGLIVKRALEAEAFEIELAFILSSLFLCIVILGLTFGLNSLGRYVFDVVAWTLESEKDERFAARRRVVDFTQRLIRQVTNDPNCGDCYIVAHSLGTCIATEALLREGERTKLAPKDTPARTHPNLEKLRAIFTVGSPIDLIFSFFQADRTFSHRYNRLYEDKRPSIGLPPFWINGRAGRTKLINIWSRFDPISSIVLSLRKKSSERRDAIVNVECLPPGFPRPISTHVSYFADPSVMEMIYKAVMLGDLRPAERAGEKPLPLLHFGRRTNALIAVGFGASITSALVWGELLLSAAFSAVLVGTWWTWRSAVQSTYEGRIGSFLKR